MKKHISSLLSLMVVGVVGLVGSTSHAAAPAKKDWTMLVYLNGNNNLDSFGQFNILQMQKAGSTDHLNVVVQWASMASEETKRLLINKDVAATTVTSPVVQSLPVVDMGSPDTLRDFIKWGTEQYPADHYMIVVWNHGAGWHFTNMSKGGMMHAQDISFDERSGNHITTEQLGQVMTETAKLIGHPVDVYGSDACLMSMVEVMQEMGGAVTTFVGSEETEPGDGWPYDLFLNQWVANPMASSNDVGKMVVDAYKQYYTAQGNTQTTMSAIDMTKIPALLASLTDLKNKLVAKADLTAVQTAAANSARYAYADYVDLTDLVDNVRASLDKADDAMVALDATSLQIKNAVYANATSGMKGAGISIWWPTESYDYTTYSQRYQGLRFDQATHWHELLARLFPAAH